jgi:hypothetical protein
VTHEPDIAEWASRRVLFKDGHIVEDVRQQQRGTAERGMEAAE